MRLLAALPLLIAAVLADYEPEAVKSAARSMTAKYHGHVDYKGPTGTASAALKGNATVTPKPTPTPPGCAPYWLENIKHQGVAAFNPTAGYQVSRNVKDFGAKGYISYINLRPGGD